MIKIYQKSFISSKNAGFTLIELLVVVLIIGILAAVAVPQYELAVSKTRVMRLLPLLRAISDAENVYYLANGSYTLDFAQLDIDMPAGAKVTTADRVDYDDFYCLLRRSNDSNTTYSAYCYSMSKTKTVALEKYFSRSYFICWGLTEQAIQICRSVSKKDTPDTTSTVGVKGFFLQ